MGPYGRDARALWALGWRGILPLPPGAKWPPPTGFTGATGDDPSYADVHDWAENQPDANVALRLPPPLIGLDVDAYGSKRGGDVLWAETEKYGPLPATWRSTSRSDGVSGIYLFTVPPGLRWPGELGPGLEIIQHRHRYVVAPSSIHPDGRPYAWWLGDQEADEPPSPDDPPPLPSAWVEGITRGELEVTHERADVTAAGAQAWLSGLASGPPCPAVGTAVTRAVGTLYAAGTGRHDATTRAVMRLCRMGAEGHIGVRVALDTLYQAFRSAVGDSRPGDTSGHEWSRMLAGAVAVVLAEGVCASGDPCANPWAWILPPGVTMPVPRAPMADAPPVDVWQLEVEAEARRVELREAGRELAASRKASRLWVPPVAGWTLTELLDAPDVPIAWTVAEILPTGSNIVLGAQFKSGKTTLGNHLAACLADGKPFLDRFAIENTEGRIALWNYEVSPGMYTAWLRRLGIAHTDRVVGMNLRGMGLPLLSPLAQEWAIRWLAERQVRQWLLDPWARAIGGSDENSNMEVGVLLDILDRIKRLAGVEDLIVSTHTGRAAQEQGAERARGATRLDDWADVRWVLTVKDDERFFRAYGREVDLEEGRLEFDRLTGSLTYCDGGRPEPGPRRSPINREDQVTKYVIEHPGCSARVVHEALRMNRNTCLGIIAALVSQGLIYRSGTGPASILLPARGATQ